MASIEVQNSINEANELLESAESPGIGTSLRCGRIDKAIQVLQKSSPACSSTLDWRLHRGCLLVAKTRAIEQYGPGELERADLSTFFYLLEQVLETWNEYNSMGAIWNKGEVAEFCRVMSEAILGDHEDNVKQEALYGAHRRLERLARNSKEEYILALTFETSYALLESCFHDAVTSFVEGDWARAMSLLKSKDAEVDILVELQEKMDQKGIIYDEDWFRRILWIWSGRHQLLYTGDLHFKEAMEGDPDDNALLARALLAQDDYRQALQYVTGQDIELEGVALARLARFHAKILKIPIVGHNLYLRAVQLATALAPMIPKGGWYQECVAAVQAYRDALEAEESKKWEALRQPILEKLADDIKKLKDGERKNNAEFVKYIFEQWPPKTEGPTAAPCHPEDPASISKKQFLKVMQRYHTDKNMARGDEWRVLSEEICKALTARYNTMKGL